MRWIMTILVVALAGCRGEQGRSSSGATRTPEPADPASVQSAAIPAPSGDGCVCSLSAGELSGREKWLASFAVGASQVGELPDGFECRFPSTWGARLLELIEKERACCSSLAFELHFEPESGPILLRCRGPVEAVSFIRSRLVVEQTRRP